MANGCTSTRAVQWGTAVHDQLRKPFTYIILLCICFSFLLLAEIIRCVQTRLNPQEAFTRTTTVGSSKEIEGNHQENVTTATVGSSKEIEINNQENFTTATIGSRKGFEVNQQESVTTTTTTILESNNDIDEDNIVTISEYGNYLVMASKDARLLSIKKDCTNCPKIYFNETQLRELRSFLEICYKQDSCNLIKWPTYRGFCIVCDPVVRMTTSKLRFCIDADGEINSAFIDNYIIYHGTLNILYSAFHYFKSDI